MNESALHSQTKNPAAPAAATASLPRCPNHSMSVMLYAICTKEAEINGKAITQRLLNMLPCVKSTGLIRQTSIEIGAQR